MILLRSCDLLRCRFISSLFSAHPPPGIRGLFPPRLKKSQHHPRVRCDCATSTPCIPDDSDFAIASHLHWPSWSPRRTRLRIRRRASYPSLLPLLLHLLAAQMYVPLPSTVGVANEHQYAYSAWAPQFADKLQLSATQSNVVVRFLALSHIQTPSYMARAPLRIWACMLPAYPWAS